MKKLILTAKENTKVEGMSFEKDKVYDGCDAGFYIVVQNGDKKVFAMLSEVYLKFEIKETNEKLTDDEVNQVICDMMKAKSLF